MKKLTRKEIMAAAGGTSLTIGLPGIYVLLSDDKEKEIKKSSTEHGKSRVPPGQRIVSLIQNMGGVPGRETRVSWRLNVSGNAEEVTLTFKDLMKLPQKDLRCDIHCVTGWTLLDSQWRGISFKDLMETLNLKGSSRFLSMSAPGGYSSSIALSEALKDNVILAYEYEGHPLPEANGAPVRMLVPDRYFYKSVKWLSGLEFLSKDKPGYYEKAGYSNNADPWKEERFEKEKG